MLERKKKSKGRGEGGTRPEQLKGLRHGRENAPRDLRKLVLHGGDWRKTQNNGRIRA